MVLLNVLLILFKILFLSVTDLLMQVLDSMRPPVPAGGPTQTSYTLTDLQGYNSGVKCCAQL